MARYIPILTGYPGRYQPEIAALRTGMLQALYA